MVISIGNIAAFIHRGRVKKYTNITKTAENITKTIIKLDIGFVAVSNFAFAFATSIYLVRSLFSCIFRFFFLALKMWNTIPITLIYKQHTTHNKKKKRNDDVDEGWEEEESESHCFISAFMFRNNGKITARIFFVDSLYLRL